MEIESQALSRVYDLSTIKTGDRVLMGGVLETAKVRTLKVYEPSNRSCFRGTSSSDSFGVHTGSRGYTTINKKEFHDGADGLKMWYLPDDFDENDTEELAILKENTQEISPLKSLDVNIIKNPLVILDDVIDFYQEQISKPVKERVVYEKGIDPEQFCIDIRNIKVRDTVKQPNETFQTIIDILAKRYKQAEKKQVELKEISPEILQIKHDAQKIISLLQDEYKTLIELPVNDRVHYISFGTPANSLPDNEEHRIDNIADVLQVLEMLVNKIIILEDGISDKQEAKKKIDKTELESELSEIERLITEHNNIKKTIETAQPALDVIENRIIYLEYIVRILKTGGNGYHQYDKEINDCIPRLESFPSIEDTLSYIEELKNNPKYELSHNSAFMKFATNRFYFSFKERKELQHLLDDSHVGIRNYFDPIHSRSFFTLPVSEYKNDAIIGGNILSGYVRKSIEEYISEITIEKLAPKKTKNETGIENGHFLEKEIQEIIDKHKNLSDFNRVIETFKDYYVLLKRRKAELYILTSVPDEITEEIFKALSLAKGEQNKKI